MNKETEEFSSKIEKLARDKKISYIDAILLYCEQTGFEIEMVNKMITTHLKQKIKNEADNLNFLKKSKSVLPV